MAISERILAAGEEKIHVHSFMAAMGELERGAVTRAQIIAAFEMAGDDITELDALIAHAAAMPSLERFKFARMLHDVLLLAEAGLAYGSPAGIRARLSI